MCTAGCMLLLCTGSQHTNYLLTHVSYGGSLRSHVTLGLGLKRRQAPVTSRFKFAVTVDAQSNDFARYHTNYR